MIGQTVRLVGPRQRAFARELVDNAPDRAVVNIRPETRSSEQNAKLWAMLSDVARAKPDGREMTTEQWKAIFMDACGYKPTFVSTLDGDGFVCLGYASSRLGKADFSDLIECIYEFGARKGIAWSEPARLASLHRDRPQPGARTAATQVRADRQARRRRDHLTKRGGN